MVSKVVGDYRLTEELGSGSFGTVYKGRHMTTGEIAAVKTISRASLSPKLEVLLGAEVESMRKISSPHVIKLVNTFMSERSYYIVMEYCAGDNLETYLANHTDVTAETIGRWAREIVEGMFAMQSLNILHRDLKLANLILTSKHAENAHVKICDFGLARVLGEDMWATTMVGTPLCSAPELLAGNPYDNKVDIWSLGVLLYEMIERKKPFPAETFQELIAMQRSPLSFGPETDLKARALIQDLLSYVPSQRPSLSEVLSHPYFSFAQIPQTIDLDQAYSSIGRPASLPGIREIYALAIMYEWKNEDIYWNLLKIVESKEQIRNNKIQSLRSQKGQKHEEYFHLVKAEIAENLKNRLASCREQPICKAILVKEAEDLLISAMRKGEKQENKADLIRNAMILLASVDDDSKRVEDCFSLCSFLQQSE